MTCLQRLIISRGLPKTRLKDALEAFNSCTDLGSEVQLKILQALPSLLQNYAAELKDDLVASALQVCAALQASTSSTVSGVASATLQQLVTTVFEQVVIEDRDDRDIATVAHVPGFDESIPLMPAAHDAYRIFRDLILAVEGRNAKFVQLAALPPESCLELIWTCMHTNASLFESHGELSSVIASNLIPVVTQALSDLLDYSITLRCLRIIDLLLSKFFAQFTAGCEVPLGLIAHTLEPDSAPGWKRAMLLEVLRNFFATGSLIVDAYAAYDESQEGKSIVQDLMSAFVRLSTEKPAVIGLGQQSSIPIGLSSQKESSTDGAAFDTVSGMSGIISSALGVLESSVPGISAQWSMPRTACLDQLDRTEPPALPETYIYCLVLECLNSLSDVLAKVVLPLSVRQDKQRSQRPKSEVNGNDGSKPDHATEGIARSQSFRRKAVPLNPLQLETSPTVLRVRTVAAIVESCWPAVLATSSTFLNAALDDQYYRALIKSYQRFAQVAGLLRLTTPRDALLTTLGKAAVPPHILNSATSDGLKSPSTESPRVFSNPRSLLSVDSLVSQASSALSSDKDRRSSVDLTRPTLTARNLLCLRALLNLAIALGPTLGSAFALVVDILKQADLILSTASPQQVARQKGTDSPSVVQAFSAEVTAVESAASRLLESTADYPNESFLVVTNTFGRLLHGRSLDTASASPAIEVASPPPTLGLKQRSFSGLPGISTLAEMHARDYKFVIPKLGNLAELNIARFVTNEPEESGWTIMVAELTAVARASAVPREARRAAADVLCKMAAGTIAEVAEEDKDLRTRIQRRAIAVLLQIVDGIYSEDGELTSADIEIQGQVVDALRAILEQSGDSLVAGWNKATAILSSVFDGDEASSIRKHAEKTTIDWTHVSSELRLSQLGRLAFSCLQLICSDFLGSLPIAVLPAVVELTHRFINQEEDLNIALTAITLAWNLSDALFDASSLRDLETFRADNAEPRVIESMASTHLQQSKSSQWLLLLFRLTETVDRAQKEVRKAAFQTICSIMKNHGGELSPAAFDLLLRSVILRVLDNGTKSLELTTISTDAEDNTDKATDSEMTSTILAGFSEVMAQNVTILTHIHLLSSRWSSLLDTLTRILTAKDGSVKAAVFSALARILARIESSSVAWNAALAHTATFWSSHSPSTLTDQVIDSSNQTVLQAYASLAAELYRLRHGHLSADDVNSLLSGLYDCVRSADGPLYGADVNTMSPLQTTVMNLHQQLQTDVAGGPSLLIKSAAKLATLHHDTRKGSHASRGPSFVALAAEAIARLQALIQCHIAEPDILTGGAVASALGAMAGIVEAKYAYRLESNGLTLWRRATSAAVAIASLVLDRLENSDTDGSVSAAVWTSCVRLSNAIITANNIDMSDDIDKVYEDQLADIESFQSLRDVMLPRLGADSLSDDLQSSYVRAIFEASIVHPMEKDEVPAMGKSPLEDLTRIRRGRVRKWPYFQREKMSYVCFAELVSLSSKSDSSLAKKKLAEAAAPLLVLRLAIPLRAYIVDQPLRGRRPQPLSEVDELLFCFEQIKKLKLEPEAFALDPIGAAKTGEKAHLHFLYPLLVKAVGTAADRWSGSQRLLEPLQEVLDEVVPMP